MRDQKNRPNRGRKPPNSSDGRNTSSNPRYLGPYPVTNPPERNPKPGSRNIPNNPDGRNTLSNPQYLGPYLVTNPPEGNPQPGSLSVLNPKEHNTQAHPRNIASRPAAKIQKGKFGKGRPRNDSTDPVASHPEATSPEPQLERPEVLDPKESQPSASPRTFCTSTSSPISPQLAAFPRQQIYQQRYSLPRRHSTGELPARDNLANKFVMGIPKQRFGIGKRRDSTASAPPVMTAEYCGDPYRTAIKKRLAAGKSRAPPDSEFAIDSRIYHMAAENAQKSSEMHKGAEPGLIEQVMSSIAGIAYAMYVFACPEILCPMSC
ncbi:hypothetical protein NCS57_00379100 [Fusarium keratoplasticum]|uniref:Uncharacterized protein n=1 Tax=Fusarium keratoplasticum TaxID=1328300 RepID=A0ACC0R588_9HYPO|nr:hypothetical protein NCS57_00379100 [Fusarium keratoplasticum]KAI8674802.1 hypothetical protein NCS57_00379100 [Fusarium keratoplasticum]